MPDIGYESMSFEQKRQAQEYESGYDWIAGRFGPPPGIPRARKEQLDRMTDRDFMAAVMRMGQEEKESLMASEAHRRRTYAILWPNPKFLDYRVLACEGFYYTGVSDRVQCAFCGGYLGNWEEGDDPKRSHQSFFSYCKMAQRKPCSNIPISDKRPDELNIDLLSMRVGEDDSRMDAISLTDLGINKNRPSNPRYKVQADRLTTYKHYSSSYPMKPEALSEAGFYFAGPGDKVRCFWCDGALECWSEGDDVWAEHAKWYPGCGFMQQIKGKEFIRLCRAEMTPEDLATAETLDYNNSGIEFLSTDSGYRSSDVSDVSEFDSYQVCMSLGYSEKALMTVFSKNGDKDFSDVQRLLECLNAWEQSDAARLDELIAEEKSMSSGSNDDNDSLMDFDDSGDERDFVNVEEIVKESYEMNEQAAAKLVEAFSCHRCRKEKIGAIILPCGDPALCQNCSLGQNLPAKCPICQGTVRGACRIYTG